MVFNLTHRDRLDSLLTKLNIAKVLLDTRPIYNCGDDPQVGSPRRKPQVPLQPIVIGNIGLIRFISHPDSQYNQSYLESWASQVSDWLSLGKTIYFFVHCPQEVRSPNTAKYFQSILAKRASNSSIPPLPWDRIDPHPTQLSLF